MVRIIMHGCNGKMGQTITAMIKEDKDAKIVAGVDHYKGIENEYPVYDALWEVKEEADVIIDFSNAEAMDSLLRFAKEKRMPTVLCTTGLSKQQLAQVEESEKTVGILKSANMSLGINLLLKLVKNAAGILYGAGFDIEIVERHHNQKVDAPSGTALTLADSINEEFDNTFEYVYDRSQVREKRTKNQIGISAIRGGTIVGDHEVIFAGADEVVELKHTAYSKAVFAKGAIEAAKFMKGKEAGHYEMSDVIQL